MASANSGRQHLRWWQQSKLASNSSFYTVPGFIWPVPWFYRWEAHRDVPARDGLQRFRDAGRLSDSLLANLDCALSPYLPSSPSHSSNRCAPWLCSQKNAAWACQLPVSTVVVSLVLALQSEVTHHSLKPSCSVLAAACSSEWLRI